MIKHSDSPLEDAFLQVVTVCRNNLDGLKRTYNSLISQNTGRHYSPAIKHPGFKWIVIDGDSTDGTKNFLHELSIANPGDTLVSAPDQGIYDAMNKGIEYLEEKGFVLFLNAGDTLPDKQCLDDILNGIKIHINCRQSAPDFIFGDTIEQLGRDVFIHKKARSPQSLIRGMFTYHQAMLYKANFLKDLRYDTEYQIAADYDLTWRYFRKIRNCSVKDVYYLNRPLCVFESGGISRRFAAQGRAEEDKIRAITGNVSYIKRKIISLRQIMAAKVRCLFPWLYASYHRFRKIF